MLTVVTIPAGEMPEKVAVACSEEHQLSLVAQLSVFDTEQLRQAGQLTEQGPLVTAQPDKKMLHPFIDLLMSMDLN